MPLYNQATRLNTGRASFSPSVSYYAGVKAPEAPNVTLPKANQSFNINLDSIGRALGQMSRDQARVEETKFKLQYAQKEKADKAAEKQLKIDISNAYAQELADVTAQVDQNIINPLAAARRVKEIDDKYRTYGVLSPSEMAPIRNNYDGGVSQYQEKTREQLRASEVAFDEANRQELIKAVPSVAGLPRDQQTKLWYDLNNVDMQLGDAVRIYNNNPDESNQALLQDKADSMADYQTQTIYMNALNSDNRYSEAEMFDMAVGGVDKALAERGVTNPQMRAYAATKAYNRYKGLAEAKASWSKQTLDYLKNQNGIYDELTLQAMRRLDPPAMLEALANKNGLTLKLPDERYVQDELSSRRLVRFGGYTQTGTGYRSNGNGEIEDYATEAVPSDYREILKDVRVPTETKSLVLGMGSVPVGPVAEAGSLATVAGAYDPNVTVPGKVLYSPATSPEQIGTAYSNNSEYMKRTKDNPVTMQNIQNQDQYAGTNRAKELSNLDERRVLNKLNDPSAKAEADSLYSKDVLPFSPSGEYSSKFFNSLVIDENTGTLSLLNKYNTSGVIDKAAAVFTANNAKQSIQNINNTAKRLFPEDTEGRNQFIRSLFHGMYPSQIPAYSYGMGGASIKPTLTEKTASVALDMGDQAAKIFSERVLPFVKDTYNIFEESINTKLNQVRENFNESYQAAKEVDPSLTPEQYVKDVAISAVQESASRIINSIDNSGIQETGVKALDTTISAVAKASEWIANKIGAIVTSVKKPEEATDWDLQIGTLNYKEPLGLPFRINEDNTWSNMLYGTVSADGRVFVAPGLDDKGELSTPAEELGKGRYFFSVKDNGEESINVAEELASRLRQYVIDINEPYVNTLTQPLGGGLEGQTRERAEWYRNANNQGYTPSVSETVPQQEQERLMVDAEDFTVTKPLLENILEAVDEVPDAALEAISDLGLAVDTKAFMTGLTGDSKFKNEWKKKYNKVGEKSFAPIRQGLYAVSSIAPFALGTGISSAYEFLTWLKDVPGVHLETDEESAIRKAAEIIEKNRKVYSSRYSTGVDWLDMLLNPNQLGGYRLKFESND